MTTRSSKRKPPMTEADRDEAAKLIMGEYMDFLLGGPPAGGPADNKAVAARHATGKGILAHLEQLFKTAGGGAEPDDAAAAAVGAALADARAQMASLEREEESADGDDAGDG